MTDTAEVTELAPKQTPRDRILDASRRPKGEKFTVPEWDMDIELRSMSIAQKAKLIGDEEPTASAALSFLPDVIVFTCYDPETGQPIFTAEDVEKLKDQPAAVIERVAGEGLRVSGLDADEAQEKKDDS